MYAKPRGLRMSRFILSFLGATALAAPLCFENGAFISPAGDDAQPAIGTRIVSSTGQVIRYMGTRNGHPIYYGTRNLDSAHTISTDDVWTAPYGLTGEEYRVSMWDEDVANELHAEFAITDEESRLKIFGAGFTRSPHATEAAGTIGATGGRSLGARDGVRHHHSVTHQAGRR